MPKFRALDIIAIIIIVGCFILRGLGVDSVIEEILKVVVYFYFGVRVSEAMIARKEVR